MPFARRYPATVAAIAACSAAPRVTMIPRLITACACSRWKFSRSRSKNGSLLFHSISSASVPFAPRRTWSISWVTASLTRPSTVSATSKRCLRHPCSASPRRSRCVERASPPPLPISSATGIANPASARISSAISAGEIHREDRLGMVAREHVESLPAQLLQHRHLQAPGRAVNL